MGLMTYRQKLPLAFGDTTLPIFKIDPILPPAGGAVWLVDPMHPTATWASGVPGHNAAIPNIVAGQNSLGIPGLDAVSLRYSTDGLITGTIGLVERTTKGGLHVILSQTDQGDYYTHSVINKYWSRVEHNFTGPSAFGSHLYGTDGTNGAWQHGYYMSMWMRVTRQTLTGKEAFWLSELARANTTASNRQAAIVANGDISDTTAHQPPSTLARIAQTRNVTVGAPRFNAIATSGKSGSVNPTSATNFLAAAFEQGHHSVENSFGTAKEANPSVIFYRSYLEDLTISGRSYAEVAAIDNALFTEDCLTAGGRYYNDTFTAPSTIA